MKLLKSVPSLAIIATSSLIAGVTQASEKIPANNPHEASHIHCTMQELQAATPETGPVYKTVADETLELVRNFARFNYETTIKTRSNPRSYNLQIHIDYRGRTSVKGEGVLTIDSYVKEVGDEEKVQKIWNRAEVYSPNGYLKSRVGTARYDTWEGKNGVFTGSHIVTCQLLQER